MVQCPAEGCDYEGEPKSVGGHYGGRQDESHSGSYQTAMNMLEVGSQTEDPEPDGGGNELNFPENPDASDPDPEPETETSRSRCPECGSGNYASGDLALEKVPNLSDRAKRALKQHEYHCHDCGEVFDL